MITDVFSSQKLEVRFNGSPNNIYTLDRSGDEVEEAPMKIYKTQEIFTDRYRSNYDNLDLYDPERMYCGFKFNRSFDLKVDNESHFVICFYNKPTDKSQFAYKIEIKDGVVYTCDGYVKAPLSKKLDMGFDDRKITCAKSANGSLWLNFRDKRN